jgi:hypothetical protein
MTVLEPCDRYLNPIITVTRPNKFVVDKPPLYNRTWIKGSYNVVVEKPLDHLYGQLRSPSFI